ncbi:MAG: O-antigen polysaccharide polymerase Wzy [Microbacterium sp.]|nr:MAG: O-antigen polysaccharide polymerase Wzy [Microbacterium sp.]
MSRLLEGARRSAPNRIPRSSKHGKRNVLRIAAIDAWLIVLLSLLAFIVADTALNHGYLAEADAREGVIVAASGMAVGLLAVRVLSGPMHPLSVMAVIAYSHFALFVLRPYYMMNEASSVNAFTRVPYGDAFVLASVVAGIGFASIAVGYGLASPPNRDSLPLLGLRTLSPRGSRRLEACLLVIAVAGFVLFGVFVLQTGITEYFSGVSGGRSGVVRRAVASSTAYLSSGLQFASGALLLLALQARLTNRNTLGYVYLVLLGAANYPDIAAGNRSVFIPLTVATILILYTTNRQVLSPLLAAIWMPLVFVFGFIAPRLWRDQLSQGIPLEQSISSAFDPTNAVGDFVGGLDTAMVDALEVQVAAQESGSLGLQYGGTYIANLLAPIPRNIWPLKPESVDELLNAALFPQTDSLGIGFAFGFYSEPYFNFGIFGVMLVCLAVGTGLGLLTKAVARSRGLVGGFILIMVIGFVFPLMRGSLTFDGQRLLIVALPSVAVAVYCCYRERHLTTSGVACVER